MTILNNNEFLILVLSLDSQRNLHHCQHTLQPSLWHTKLPSQPSQGPEQPLREGFRERKEQAGAELCQAKHSLS